jgi:putative DNA methylase
MKIKAPKKLIEVALPLKEINEACAHEKMPGIGPHPRGIHLWWARRPLAAARAVLFAQLVNDPGWDEELKIGYKRKADANRERERLFGIIRELVKWENTNNELVLNIAREEIRNSWRITCELNKDHPEASERFNPAKLPAFHDPFAGGGSIPLEAQRLGLEAWASDLNPVAVLINKAMIEIPPKFIGRRPIGPIPEHEQQLETGHFTWEGVTGLAEDVRRYGHWMREEADKRIGHLYPPIEITKTMVEERPDLAPYQSKKLPVIAYIWVRTVKSPNPLYSHVNVPLASTFLLSDKKGKEVFVDPIINNDKYEFKVKVGKPIDLDAAKKGTKADGKASNFYCLLSKTPIEGKYIKLEGQAGRIDSKLMAIVAEGKNCRVYLSPSQEQDNLAKSACPDWKPDLEMNQDTTDLVSGRGYGFRYWHQLFTSRQLTALTTLSDLIKVTHSKISQEATQTSKTDLELTRRESDSQMKEYADAVVIYLAFAIDRCADFSNSCTRWVPGNQKIMNLFGKQAIAMTWDYAEAGILNNVVGGFVPAVEFISNCLNKTNASGKGYARQADASSTIITKDKIISTDPPYYNNIGYADLSDFFYIWLRFNIKEIIPDLFSTLSTPKDDELIASSYRHDSKEDSEAFFLNGMTKTMRNFVLCGHEAFPVTIYYAFKQSETKSAGTSSTGWETFLEAIIRAGFSLCGTWPLRSEQEHRMIGMGTNALASSIVLVCRKRNSSAATISRKDFLQELNVAIPEALETMINGSETSSPVAPVDLAQASIGPGMAVYSKYKAILESDGNQMTVHTALILINKALDKYFKEREGDWDNDTRFCLQWFSEYGWKEGAYGEAEVLAKAKGLSVEGVRDSGVLIAGSGKVRLYRPAEYPSDWNPLKDDRTPVWEVLHQLIRAHQSSGESAAAEIASAVPQLAATARQLAFLLYTLCERQGWAEDARPYNDLVTAWLSIEKQAQDKGIKDAQIEAEFEFET